jgi:hypothetical protein
MSEWQPIEKHPDRPMPVLFFLATAVWHDTSGAVADIPDLEAMRYEIGYWDGSDFLDQGTNHFTFEDCRPGEDPDDPTHWMPLPEPPK